MPTSPFATNCSFSTRAKHFSRVRSSSLKPRKTSLLEGAGGVESVLKIGFFSATTPSAFCANNLASLNSRASASTIIRKRSPPPARSFTTCAKTPRAVRTRAHGSTSTQPPSIEALQHLDRIRYYEQQDALVLDPVTVRNLELVAPIFTEESARSGPVTLVAALDETVTGMGARLLRSWILRPLIDREAIEARLDAVAHLVQQTVVRGEIRKELRGMQDLERLTSRITLGVATPRELVALRKSLAQLPAAEEFPDPSSWAAARFSAICTTKSTNSPTFANASNAPSPKSRRLSPPIPA